MGGGGGGAYENLVLHQHCVKLHILRGIMRPYTSHVKESCTDVY